MLASSRQSKGENLSFRERFEMHRSKATCAVCHNKIDPLGFALQAYDNGGGFRRNTPKEDTAGRLPTGESLRIFKDSRRSLYRAASSTRSQHCRTHKAYALCRA